MKNIHALCKKVVKLTEAELDAADAEIASQKSFMHPLKMKTAGNVRAAGNHNERVMVALRNLRTVILTP